MPRRSYRAIAATLLCVLALQSSAAPTPPRGFISQFEWPSDDPLLGGLSAIELSSDGQDVTMLSDSGAVSQGVIARDAEGRIAAVTLAPFWLLHGKTEAPLQPTRNDSEGLAIGPDGTAYISFEGVARVLRYGSLTGPAENLPVHDDFNWMQENSALEALAMDDQGRLYTMPERSGGKRRPFAIYRFENGDWAKVFSLPRTDDFLPVGADFGPDGRLYILMRQFHGLAGFASKLIRVIVGENTIGPPEVMFESPIGFHDNLEGVAIWRDVAGHLRATMVADNNYLPFLSSGLVEYQLPD